MRAFPHILRKSSSPLRLPIWTLLLVVMLAHPATLPVADAFFRTADSLSTPAFAADFTGTPAQITPAKDRLPVAFSLEVPAALSLPQPAETCEAPVMPATAHLPRSIEPSTPSQPRSPPVC